MNTPIPIAGNDTVTAGVILFAAAFLLGIAMEQIEKKRKQTESLATTKPEHQEFPQPRFGFNQT